MSYSLTEFTDDHLPELRRIFLDARRETFSWNDPEGYKLEDFDSVIRGEIVLVAVENNAPIGFIAWWPPENFIHSLFVDPQFTGKGAGKLLLDGCLEQLERPAALKCLQANKKALGFYKAQGWEITGEGGSEEGNYYFMSLY